MRTLALDCGMVQNKPLSKKGRTILRDARRDQVPNLDCRNSEYSSNCFMPYWPTSLLFQGHRSVLLPQGDTRPMTVKPNLSPNNAERFVTGRP